MSANSQTIIALFLPVGGGFRQIPVGWRRQVDPTRKFPRSLREMERHQGEIQRAAVESAAKLTGLPGPR